MWSTGRFFATFILELGGLAIIARLVTPAEMGLFVAAFAVIRFGQFVAGMGTHMVVVRGERIDAALVGHVAATLTVTTTMVAVCLSALVLADLDPFGIGETRTLIAIMLPGLIVNSLGVPANALLTRDFRFRAIFFLHVLSALVFQGVAIPLAATGLGASALAYATLASTIVFVGFATLATRARFLRLPRLAGIGETTRFSVTIFLTSIADEMQRMFIVLLVGKLGGAAELGIYSRAQDLISKLRIALQQSTMSIVTPLMFDAQRENRDLGRLYLDSLSMLLVITLPMGIGLACVSEPLTAILLGPGWGDVAQVLAILSVIIATLPLGLVASSTAVAKGRQGAIMWLAIARAITSIAVVAILARNGVRDVAIGISTIALASHLITTMIAWRLVGVSASAFIRALEKSLTVSALALVPAVAFVVLGTDLAAVWRLVVPVLLSVAAWAAAIFALDHPLKHHAQAIIARRRAA